MARSDPEHNLQVQIVKWVRSCVPQPHWFFSSDRAKAFGQFTHAREKARGVKKGQTDTHLLCPGLPAICIELKAKGRELEPDGVQEHVGAAIQAAGHLWDWTDTVVGYCAILRSAGVPLAPRAEFWAKHYDAVLAGAAIRKEETKTSRPSRRRFAAKPTVGQVAKAEALRARVRY